MLLKIQCEWMNSLGHIITLSVWSLDVICILKLSKRGIKLNAANIIKKVNEKKK